MAEPKFEMAATLEANSDPAEDDFYLITTKNPDGTVAATQNFYRMTQSDLAALGKLDPNNEADRAAIAKCADMVNLTSVVGNFAGLPGPGNPASCFCVALYLDTLDQNLQAAAKKFKAERAARFPAADIKQLAIRTAETAIKRATERLALAERQLAEAQKLKA